MMINQDFSLIEQQVSPNTRNIPLALHFSANDVQVEAVGGYTGLGVFLFCLDTDDRDTVNLMGNTFIASDTDSHVPVAMIAGASRCAVTGNTILNEGGNVDIPPLT